MTARMAHSGTPRRAFLQKVAPRTVGNALRGVPAAASANPITLNTRLEGVAEMAFSPADYRAEFKALISGQRRGVQATLLRGLLRAAEVPYTLAVQLRNRQYDRGRKPVERVAVPVISVGNLTLGGTGKTPLVEWLARWFRQRGVRVTIISRGYGAEAGRGTTKRLN